MKNIFILSVPLLFILIIGCMYEPPPDIESITTSGSPVTQITITLEGDNRVDLAVVKTKITLTKGGFTGDQIDFTITGAVPGKTYTVDNFIPVLQIGKDYFFVFEEGAFGNYGQWSLTGQNDKSDPIVWKFEA